MRRAVYKNFIKLMSVATLLFLFMILTAVGKTEAATESGSGNLTVHTSYEDTDIPGVTVKVYNLTDNLETILGDAEVSVESGMMDRIEAYINSSGMTEYASGTTGSDGCVSFSGLPDGTYYIKCESVKIGKNKYSFLDSLITMPYYDEDGNTTYEVTVTPKVEVITEGEDPETYYVYKRWSDSGHTKKRPTGITVYIYCDGNLYETISLNASNNWTYSWSYEKGHSWSVAEAAVSGYSTVVSHDGTSFTITNTYKKKHHGSGGGSDDDSDNSDGSGGSGSSESSTGDWVDIASAVLGEMEAGVLGDRLLPQTGQLWWPLPALLLLGIIFIAAGIRLNRKK